MQTQSVEYQEGKTLCRGFLAYDESRSGPQPTVLVVHAFDGVTDFIRDYAAKIVEAGYVAFCVDMYGDGKTATTMDDSMALVMPFFQDRELLQRRILAGFKVCQQQQVVDENRIAAIGFCFGGTSCLDLARAGADVKAVVSMHGNLLPPEGVEQGDFTAKALILHGYDDPMCGHDQLPILAKELNAKKVDWQFVYFSHTQHAFTEPGASKIGGEQSGRVYNADSARRSWEYCQLLFKEVF